MITRRKFFSGLFATTITLVTSKFVKDEEPKHLKDVLPEVMKTEVAFLKANVDDKWKELGEVKNVTMKFRQPGLTTMMSTASGKNGWFYNQLKDETYNEQFEFKFREFGELK